MMEVVEKVSVCSVMNSGTHFMLEVLGYDETDLLPYRPGNPPPYAQHTRRLSSIEMSRLHKTVIPLRHPAMVAVSHKKRDWKARKGYDWFSQWFVLDHMEGFFFPLEKMPFDDLEEFLGRPVNRIDKLVSSLGQYPEKQSMESAREYLGNSEWELVQLALSTDVGKRYYQ